MKRTKPDSIPDDVYIQFVRSLFNSAHTVIVGACLMTLLTFLVYVYSGQTIYGLLALERFSVCLNRMDSAWGVFVLQDAGLNWRPGSDDSTSIQ